MSLSTGLCTDVPGDMIWYMKKIHNTTAANPRVLTGLEMAIVGRFAI